MAQTAKEIAADSFKKLGAVQDDANTFRLGGNEFRMDENGRIFQTRISHIDEKGGSNNFELNMLNAGDGKVWENLPGLGLDGLLRHKNTGSVYNFIKGQSGGGTAVQVTDEALQDYQSSIERRQRQKERINTREANSAQVEGINAAATMSVQQASQPQGLMQQTLQPQGLMQQIVSDTPFQTYGTTQKYLGQDLNNIQLSNVQNYLGSLDSTGYLSLLSKMFGK